MMGYWNDLSEVLSGKSLRQPIAEAEAEGLDDPDSLTLFEAVRSAVGIRPSDMDCADVAFWEWREMRSLMLDVWGALNAAATKRSHRREMATVWVHKPEQSALDVDDLIAEARSHAPLIPSLKVNRRPDGYLMVNAGKADSAVASTVAVVVKESGLPYGEVLQKLLTNGGKDEDLLAFLDGEVERLGGDRSSCDQSPIPRELIRAKQKIRDEMELSSLSIANFLQILDSTNNLTNTTDDALLGRLLHIAPEKNKSIAKKIDAIRSAVL